ncbi:MAG: TIGR03960 family B12-binding radical SAM protein [Thermaerobacter sp.]|nr:TIGR03960 family B12-binding radical SAM protein [Thermaerobacter sp.]
MEEILLSVQKPARYVGSEWNAVHKDWDRVDVTFALAFPDLYEVGMSHLGLQILYHELNRREDTLAERVFAPAPDLEAVLRRRGLPLFALESHRGLRDFDILGFTLQYELTYTNILNMLDLGGIPLQAADRGEGDPLVVGGGPGAFNPEPLVPFFDCFVLGEGEEVVHELVDGWRESAGRSREDRLRRLAAVPGVYVPSLYQVRYGADGTVAAVQAVAPAPSRVMKRVVADLDELDYPTYPVVPSVQAIHERAMVEVFRGCTRGCRFCQAGIIYRPVRERSPRAVVRLAQEILAHTGYDEVSLVSLSTADYSGIDRVARELARDLAPRGQAVSLPSLRVDAFSVELARTVRGPRKTGLTFAPEAGTQRLRDVINKGVREEDLMAAAQAAFSQGWEALKLYFMIGLPTETEADVAAIAQLARRVRDLGGSRSQVTVSVSSFVPKPHTPFQWEPQDPPQTLLAKQALLRRVLRGRGLSLRWHEVGPSWIEGTFSRGDRRMAAVLEEAWRHGCRLDGWGEHFRPELWEEAFRAAGADPAFYNARRRSPEEIFPWDHLDSGATREFLWEENQRALTGEATADCRWEGCYLCGVCQELPVDVRLKAEVEC